MQQQDWFASNAPKAPPPQGQDWFAANSKATLSSGPDDPGGNYDFGPLGKVSGATKNGRPATRQEALDQQIKLRGFGQAVAATTQNKQQDVSKYVQSATDTDQQTKDYMGDLATMAVTSGAGKLADVGHWTPAPGILSDMSGAIAGYTPSGSVPKLLGREVTGRIPVLKRFEKFRTPTFGEYWDALKPDPQMSLFKNTPKIGEATPAPYKAGLGAAPAAVVNPLERPLVGGTLASAANPSSVAAVAAPDVLPHIVSGEGVINQALTALDNKTLIRIAKSRGIDVAAEAQLKPGVADQRIIKKIIGDFSQDELDEARDVGIEISRHQAVGSQLNGAAGKDLWHYKTLSTFFPDVQIPKAMEGRAQTAMAARPGVTAPAATPAAAAPKPAPAAPQPQAVTNESDLEDALKRSIEATQKAKTPPAADTSDVRAAQAAAARGKPDPFFNPKPPKSGFGPPGQKGIEETPAGQQVINAAEKAAQDVFGKSYRELNKTERADPKLVRAVNKAISGTLSSMQ